MSQQPCNTCPGLRAEVARLQTEVAMLLRIIGAAQGECMRLADEADKTMSGHVPRGTWAYASSKKETAEKILKRLS